MSSLLSGCSSSQPAASGGGKSVSSSSKEITVWSFTDEAKYAIQKFEEKYPDIKVNLVYIPGNQYETKLRSALQTGAQAPDAFALENGFVRKFIDNPALADLGPYAKDLISQQYPYVQATEKDSKGNIKNDRLSGNSRGNSLSPRSC